MKRYPNIWKLHDLHEYVARGESSAGIKTPFGTKWVPARPSGFCSIGQRIKAAKLVFSGKADAVTWEGQ